MIGNGVGRVRSFIWMMKLINVENHHLEAISSHYTVNIILVKILCQKLSTVSQTYTQVYTKLAIDQTFPFQTNKKDPHLPHSLLQHIEPLTRLIPGRPPTTPTIMPEQI